MGKGRGRCPHITFCTTPPPPNVSIPDRQHRRNYSKRGSISSPSCFEETAEYTSFYYQLLTYTDILVFSMWPMDCTYLCSACNRRTTNALDDDDDDDERSPRRQAMTEKELFCSKEFRCGCSATTLYCYTIPCQPLTARTDDLYPILYYLNF